MSTASPGAAPDISIDLASERVLASGREIALRPKTWMVLRYLAERPGVLVTKSELLEAVWPDTAVAEGVLNKSIGELRAALGDGKDAPVCIETVPRRGFRWIARHVFEGPSRDVAATNGPGHGDTVAATIHAAGGLPDHFVGCRRQLEALQRSFDLALSGRRQVVFVTGEAGAGKSTLVDAFVGLASRHAQKPVVARGQCIEAFGEHEPYRPLLEAIDLLVGRLREGHPLPDRLRTLTPSLARQLPSLASGESQAFFDASAVSPRLLRDLATAVEEIAREFPLVLVLEDMHWADLASLDALNLLARRRDEARLLLLVTMRTADAVAAAHPVVSTKADLIARALAGEVATTPMSEEGIGDYLGQRCDGFELDAGHAALIQHQTGGNPLFVRVLADDLIARGLLARNEAGVWTLQAGHDLHELVPDNLRALVERQIESLSPDERAVVEAASVLSGDFDPAWVAAPAGVALDDAEDACERLARRGRILRASTRPVGSRFAFVHSLVQRILRSQVSESRLQRFHQAAAARLQAASPGASDTAAVELALHLAMGGDDAGAIRQLQRAASSVQTIPAPREVIPIRQRILELVESNPSLPGFRRERLAAMMELSSARQLAFGGVDAETMALCERILALAVEDDDAGERFTAKLGLVYGRFFAARYGEALVFAGELLDQARAMQAEPLVLTLEFAISTLHYRRGEIDEARRHFEGCLRWNPDPQLTFGWNFHCMALSHLALIAIHDGAPGYARELIGRADAQLRPDGVPRDASVIPMLAWALAVLGDDAGARAVVDRALLLSNRLDSVAWFERARFLDGLLRSRAGHPEEGLRRMRASLERQDRHGLKLDRSGYCSLLGGELLRLSDPSCGEVLEQGIAHCLATDEGHFEAELYRLRGLFRAKGGDAAAAAADQQRSIEAATRHGDRWTALKAGLSLAALPAAEKERSRRLDQLEQACAPFAGGDEPSEAADARALFATRTR